MRLRVDAGIPNRHLQIRTLHFWVHCVDDFVQEDKSRGKETSGVIAPDCVVRGDAN